MKKIICICVLAAGLLSQSCTEEVILRDGGENDPIETPPPPPPPPPRQ